MDAGPVNGFEHPDAKYIADIKRLIAAWRADAPGVVTHLLGYAATPVSWLLQTLVPQRAIESAISGLDWLAKHSLSPAHTKDFNDIRACDCGGNMAVNRAVAMAIVEGGAAGFLGLVALPLDIPAVVTLALRTIRQVGVEYGYSENNEEERRFTLSILAAAGANTQVEKTAALAAAAAVMNVLTNTTWKAMAAKAAGGGISVEAAVIGVRSLAKQLGVNLTKRKALAAVPVIGAAVGASMNGWFIREVGVAAQRLYQERWLRDRGLLIDGELPGDQSSSSEV